ncbi:MAG TPA: S8 family serine peptidase [Chthoniobacterales bacterium]|jgi:subtilisin|nr:S8 family serine peptidase [Chthoniobacterales bacterium]
MESTLTRDPSPFRLEEARRALKEGTGKGVRIAVIDSGVETDHPALSGLSLVDDLHVVDAGVQIEVKEGDGTDVFGHGTAVTAVIRRIAPDARVGSIRVLGANLGSRTVIIREGVRQAIDRGYHILNCSFGCGLSEHIFQYKEWIDEAYLKGIHIVSACNNYDFTTPEWPGYFPSVVTVNMARFDEDHTFFYKPGHLVEFAARGVDVTLPWNNKGTKEVTGSSFAAPIMSALLARLVSQMPDLAPLEAKSILHRLAIPWRSDVTAPNVVSADAPAAPAARAGKPPPSAPVARAGKPPPAS